MELAGFVILLLAVLAVGAAALMRHRGRRVGRGAAVRRRSSRMRRRGAGREGPMAAVVASHSQALDPHDVAVEELRLRAQANRVAAATHEREADALESGNGADDHSRMQAEAHRDAAARHQQTAADLDRRAPHGGPGAPGYPDPLAGEDRSG